MKLICIGDSLTYGLGVPVEDSWVEILNRESAYQVQNKGINGDTSGGMLARFGRDVLEEKPAGVFLMGGSNDFIMGCDISVVKANLMAMVHQARAYKLPVILASEITGDIPHVRQDWGGLADFYEVDRKLTEMSAWLVDFCRVFQIPFVNLHDRFEQAAAGEKSRYFIDGVHPNKIGHRLIADIILQDGLAKGSL